MKGKKYTTWNKLIKDLLFSIPMLVYFLAINSMHDYEVNRLERISTMPLL